LHDEALMSIDVLEDFFVASAGKRARRSTPVTSGATA
jgi:hypothetical protein